MQRLWKLHDAGSIACLALLRGVLFGGEEEGGGEEARDDENENNIFYETES